MNQELLSAGKIAEKLGTSKKDVNNAIKTIGLKPDRKEGNCELFSPICVEAIQKMISNNA